MKRKLLLLLVMAITTFAAHSGGYQINSMGIKQNGMGYVGTAFAPDASSIFFNPGALALMPHKFSFSGGVVAVLSKTKFQKAEPSVYQATSDNPMGTPLNFYAAARFNNLAVGLGIFTPYGNTVKWGDTWDGRYLISQISFKCFNIQPTISYKINDIISVGAGFNYVTGDVEIQKMLPLQGADSEGKATLSGKTTNFGFTAGIMLKPIDKFSIGFMYRNKVQMELGGGDAKFEVPSALANNFPSDNTFDAALPLPSNLNIGVGYKMNEKLEIGCDINYVFWSEYDSLIFDFEKNTTALEDSRNPRLYKDAVITRVGAQYKFNDMFTFRGGAYYDFSPVENDYLNPETPSADQIGLTIGLSARPIKNLSIDAALIYLHGLERTARYSPSNFGGTYQTKAMLPGIGVSYSF